MEWHSKPTCINLMYPIMAMNLLHLCSDTILHPTSPPSGSFIFQSIASFILAWWIMDDQSLLRRHSNNVRSFSILHLSKLAQWMLDDDCPSYNVLHPLSTTFDELEYYTVRRNTIGEKSQPFLGGVIQNLKDVFKSHLTEWKKKERLRTGWVFNIPSFSF